MPVMYHIFVGDPKDHRYRIFAVDYNNYLYIGASDYSDWVSNNTIVQALSPSDSDKNVKNSISSFENKYEILFDNLKPCKYKYNYGTSNRFHTGFIAQEVVEALEKANLTTQDFAAVMKQEPDNNGCEW
jgi:hypothetical protein